MNWFKNWWYSDSTSAFVIQVLILSIGAFGIIIAMMVTGIYKVNQWECQDITSAMERDYKYGLMKGCMVEDDSGDFVPLDNWRHEE